MLDWGGQDGGVRPTAEAVARPSRWYTRGYTFGRGAFLMRRLGFLLILPILLSWGASPAAAQSRFRGLEMGTQFGRGIAELTMDGVRVDESKSGVFFGFLTTHRVVGPLALQGELNLAVKGGRSAGEVQGQPILFDLDLTYLELPLYAVLQSPRIAAVTGFRAFAGASLEPLVGCEIELVDSPGGARPGCRDLVAGLDLGLTAGVGMDIYLEGLTIRLDLRRTIGQRDVTLDGEAPLRNRTTVVSVGLMLF